MSTIDYILGEDGESRLTQQNRTAVVPGFVPEIQGTVNHNVVTDNSNNSDNSGRSGDGVGVNVGRKRLSYVEMMQRTTPYRPQTEAEKADEEKKRKRDMLLATIGNGLSAFHHAYTTSTGQRSMVNPRMSLTGRVRERYDRLQKERDVQRAAYNNAYMKAVMMDEEADDRDRRWQRQLGIDKMNADKMAKEQERKDAIAEAQRGKYNAAANKDAAMTAYYNTKIKMLEDGADLDLANKQAALELKRAQKLRLISLANGGGSGGGNGMYYGTFNGIEYKTKADYDAAYHAAVQEWNKNNPDDQIPLTYKVTEGSGHKAKTIQKPRSAGAVVGDYNNKQKQKDNWALGLKFNTK